MAKKIVEVYRREGEDLESLMHRFRRVVNNANILNDYKKHEEFISKPRARLEKRKANIAKQRRNGSF